MTGTSLPLTTGHHGVQPSVVDFSGIPSFDTQSDLAIGSQPGGVLFFDRDHLVSKAEAHAVALAASEERLRFTHEAGRIGSWMLDLVSMELVTSDGCKANFGRDPRAAFTYEAWIEAVHPDDRDRMQGAIATSVSAQTDYDIEYRITCPDGDVHWIQSRGQASYRPGGAAKAIGGISMDITDRKRVEEHRDLLAKELGHRVKNNLATIQSIVRQTLRNAASLKDAEVALDARIVALAAAHDVLIRDSWEGATLAEVVLVAMRPFGAEREDRFTLGGPPVRLASRAALAFAMAFHELATNAVKYGALSMDAGRVLLAWDIVGEGSSGRFRFRWQETGGPSVSTPTRTGFGSRMIERALSFEIGGTARIDYHRDGVVFACNAPLSAVVRM